MNQRNAVWLLAAAITCVLLFIIACDDDKPTEPTPPAELRDYVAYTYDRNTECRYYGYHPANGQLDSFDLAVKPAHGMRVSADGSQLYVVGEETTWIVSLDSFKVVGELPLFGGVELSPDGSLMAIWNNGLSIVNTSDFSIVFQADDVVGNGVFSSDSKSFYALGAGYVYKVHLEGDFPETRKWLEDRTIYHVLPSIEEDRWFLYSAVGTCLSAFEVYDPILDSIIHTELLSPGKGEIALTPDGRYVFYTNTDSWITYCIDQPSTAIFVFDIHNNQPLPEISLAGIADSLMSAGVSAWSLEVTPDGRWLVGLHDYYFCLVVVDLETMEVARHHIMDGTWDVSLITLRCQSGL